ncbi:MAG: hypothetical protein AAGJ10_00660 [Bacteroidota bacterium]
MRVLIASLFAVTMLTACDATTPIAPDAPYTQAEVDALVARWNEGQPSFGEITAMYLAAFGRGEVPEFTHESSRDHNRAFMASMDLMMNLYHWSRDGYEALPSDRAAAFKAGVERFTESHALVLQDRPHIAGRLGEQALQVSLHPRHEAVLPDASTRLYYLQLALEYGPIQEWSVWTYHLEQLQATHWHSAADMARRGLIQLAAKEQAYYAEVSLAKRFYGWLIKHTPESLQTPPSGDEVDPADWEDFLHEMEEPWRPHQQFKVVEGQVEPDASRTVDVTDIRTRLMALL